MAATPWLLCSALKIELCFSIMQISNNPVKGGWGSVKRSSSRPTTHPSNAVVTAPQGPRQLRQTLASKHQASVALFLRNGVIPPDSLGTVKVDLHTAAVAEAIIGMDAKPNRVLSARPPPVDSSVTDLAGRLSISFSHDFGEDLKDAFKRGKQQQQQHHHQHHQKNVNVVVVLNLSSSPSSSYGNEIVICKNVICKIYNM